jgi:hypothetical protein
MEWQQAIALLIVAGAVLWLVRQALRGRASGCGGCHGCAPSTQRREASPLIELDPPPSARRGH